MAKSTLEAQNGWVFDFSNFLAGDFETFNDALRAVRVSEIAETLPLICVSTPYGDAKDANTYKKIPIKEFLNIGTIVGEALKEDSKK